MQTRGLTERVLQDVVETTRDHQELLLDLAVRLEPHLAELTEAWAKAYRELAVREPLPPDEAVLAIQQEAVRVLFGGLRQGNLLQYYKDIQDWAYRTARSGLPYDQVLVLLQEYQRTGIPFLRRAYALGPELELVLGALDDLHTGTVTLIGAVYVEAGQEQLIYGVRQRALGQLTSGAAHALNNMLTAILGRTQLLLERARDTESRGDLQDIQHSAALGAQMVRRLQDFARAGRDERMVETDVNLLVCDAAEITRFIWRDQAEVDGIVIDVVKDLADVPPILARPNDLREVLISMIFNAVEGMPRGGLITIRTERKGENVLAAVTDTGEGMSEATRLRIFDPFFTTKGMGHSGLGLANAKTTVEQHHGTVTVTSELGHGTTITLAIPVAPSTVPSRADSMPPTVRPVKILIVDDEPTVRDILAKFLTFRGYQVKVSDSGGDGIASFKRTGFDLVVTDLGMPGLSGWDVAREVKRINPKTLVVLMTGWAADLDDAKVKESGVDRVVHKPFDVDEVVSLVNEAMALKEKL